MNCSSKIFASQVRTCPKGSTRSISKNAQGRWFKDGNWTYIFPAIRCSAAPSLQSMIALFSEHLVIVRHPSRAPLAITILQSNLSSYQIRCCEAYRVIYPGDLAEEDTSLDDFWFSDFNHFDFHFILEHVIFIIPNKAEYFGVLSP